VSRRSPILSAFGTALLLTLCAPSTLAADPMQPSYVKPSVAGRLVVGRRPAAYQLQAIMGTAGDRIAVVNGRVLRPGDAIGAARLRRIGASFIELQERRRRWLLRLPAAPLD
jgi:hypothetical protein